MKGLGGLIDNIDSLDQKIGSVLEMDPQTWEILGTLYEEENIFLKSIELIEKDTYLVEYVFPEYSLTKQKVDHVSASQMQIAIFQGLYMSIGLYISSHKDKNLHYDRFMKGRVDALYRRDKRTFKKMLKPGEKSYLIFQPLGIEEKRGFYSIQTLIKNNPKVFLHGEVECVLTIE